MVNIFDAFNHLDQQIQSGGVNIVEEKKHSKAFQKKLLPWKTTNRGW